MAARGATARSRRRSQPDGPYRIVTFPAFKLERRLNELNREGWALLAILERDSASVRCLLEAKGGRG